MTSTTSIREASKLVSDATAWGILSRLDAEAALAQTAVDAALPSEAKVAAQAGPAEGEVMLPTLAGIAWMLFLTHTPLSIPALTDAIMSVGLATASSILVMSFACGRACGQGVDAQTTAPDARLNRFRLVLMTALAMIVGMVPMALSLGEGDDQNASLGPTVIDDLCLVTVATVLFVPTVFSLIGGGRLPP